MKVVIDIEANGLENPTEIWLIVCKDIDTGELHLFRNVTSNPFARERFVKFYEQVDLWIGHHILGYDLPTLYRLLSLNPVDVSTSVVDTLIVSKLHDYSRTEGHSIEAYGEEFGIDKGQFYKFTDEELYNTNSILYHKLEEYCIRDVEIAYKVYLKYKKFIDTYVEPLKLEHKFQLCTNELHYNGFSFNITKAKYYLSKVEGELSVLDKEISEAFPPRLKLIKEITPRLTKYETLNRSDFRWHRSDDLSEFNGGPFCRCKWEHFNPASHKQLIEILHLAGWSPVDKTQTHIDTERELRRLKFGREHKPLDIETLSVKLEELKKSGWKINESNLDTLPPSAPAAARLLAKRILLEARRRTLTEWLALVQDDGRIHGRFYGIGAWTHRMAHQAPNTANIPTGFKMDGSPKLLGKEMRSLWRAPRNRLLVGVDAEGIQLRIFAHYINDEEFTDALVKGTKRDKTDPHNLNQRILGRVCKSRDAAKRFIYALLLGAGIGKLAQILECSIDEAKEALARLMERYTGFRVLKETVIPADGKRGWFTGLDGRKVPIPGDTASSRSHLAMSGYLQNGEAIIIKRTAVGVLPSLLNSELLVNIVHDELITEVANDVRRAEEVKEIYCAQIEQVGKDLKLRCPLKGDGIIGLNWSEVH